MKKEWDMTEEAFGRFREVKLLSFAPAVDGARAGVGSDGSLLNRTSESSAQNLNSWDRKFRIAALKSTS